MNITSLFHVSIKTKYADLTRRFYEEIFAMKEAPRPPFEFPGFWMQVTSPHSQVLLHVYTGDAAVGPGGTVPTGSGAIDHVAFSAYGFEALKERCKKWNVPYREREIPNFPLWQIFVYDPNGIQFEFNFHSQAEVDGKVDPDNFPVAGASWFDATAFEALIC